MGEDTCRLTAGFATVPRCHDARRTMDFKSRSVNIGTNAKLIAALLCPRPLVTSFCARQDATSQKAPPQQPPQAFLFVQPEPINFGDHDGWVQIFDAKTLSAWDGPSDIWHVEDGALVGESSPDH